jgi:hypothetical protein
MRIKDVLVELAWLAIALTASAAFVWFMANFFPLWLFALVVAVFGVITLGFAW